MSVTVLNTTAQVTGIRLALIGSANPGHLIFTDALYDIGASGATRPRDLFLSRNAVIGGTLGVTGVSTFTGSVVLPTLTQNLIFTDATYDIGASGLTRPRDLFLSRNAVIGGTLGVTGVATFTAQAVLNGGATFAGNLIATDNLYDIGASGATRFRDIFLSRNAVISGTLSVGGAVTLDGAVTLGNAAADNIVITGTLQGDIIFADNLYDIGKSGATRPRDGFFARNVVISGTLNVVGAVTLDTTLGVTGLATFTTAGLSAPVSALGTVYSSSYTPTLSAGVNVAASTMNTTGYTRIGNFVVVAGTFNIDPTAAGPTETSFELSLPVASNIGAISDLGGAAMGVTVTGNVLPAMVIRGNVANNTADCLFYAASAANQTFSFLFAYRVI